MISDKLLMVSDKFEKDSIPVLTKIRTKKIMKQKNYEWNADFAEVADKKRILNLLRKMILRAKSKNACIFSYPY